MQELRRNVEIGEMQFSIEKVSTFSPHIDAKLTLKTDTPLVLRIPKERYAEYRITSRRPYEYWRPQYDFDAFLKQLNDNLLKKYNQYYGKNVNEYLFEEFEMIDDPLCVHRVENGKEVKTVCTLWKFGFNHLEKERKKIIEFALDTGLGELNSSGFGFVNVVGNAKA